MSKIFVTILLPVFFLIKQLAFDAVLIKYTTLQQLSSSLHMTHTSV